MLLNKYLLVCFCFLLSLFSTRMLAADLKFITLEVAPWAYKTGHSRTMAGIFPALVKEIELRTGHNIEITLAPYVRINRELRSGRQDCTMLVRDKEREEITENGELIFNHPMGVVARKGVLLTRYEHLRGMNISLLRGLNISPDFDQDAHLKKEFDTDYHISLLKMQHGRLDAIAGALPTIRYLASKNGMADILGHELELRSEPIYLQCGKSSQHLSYMPEINQVIKDIKSDETLDKILADY